MGGEGKQLAVYSTPAEPGQGDALYEIALGKEEDDKNRNDHDGGGCHHRYERLCTVEKSFNYRLERLG